MTIFIVNYSTLYYRYKKKTDLFFYNVVPVGKIWGILPVDLKNATEN